ncbi:MAG: dephospho-CoA kinase [Nitrospirae bacterium]|nr:MAG: dephospho-CoA kinase [Nitrospirota bacterium]
MLVVGLTGGLASGKSTVAKLFEECGAIVIDADQLARQVVQPGRAAWKDIIREFGPSILQADRTINRKALADLVFRDPQKLAALNRIVHPRVAREQVRLVNTLAKRDPHAVVIYDAALLIEAGAHTRMDVIIVVTANQEVQLRRAQQRDGISRAEARRRIRGQLPLRVKRQYADYLLDGTLPPAKLRSLVRRLYQQLKQRALAMDHRHQLGKRRFPRRQPLCQTTSHTSLLSRSFLLTRRSILYA